ncbi:ABC transporter permease [Methylocystis sp. MJC1]|jgi:cell division transport system permease protein|uniref:cell division protein FtsX n=1 Tax=Methylocystis sp. MJC1 TaxID=2654282 RepID=UPI0013E9B7A3|nr:ABC transporter permease [Methylocystis sp. MJC1]KAF2991718.1 Cell division protein FtsX [Methylocystis sp. MJC1]MBU6527043.1 ABC transporter permease [Methylocystis sp. MJC1]UZX13480.1 ABC transporter permease [Methylocystis sp. MJC1]
MELPPLVADLLARVRVLRQSAPVAEEEAAFRSPLVPTDSVAGRSLVIVIAIMTFLAALAAGAALLVAQASVEWRAEASSEVSVQVRPTPGRDIEADLTTAAEILRKTAGVREAQIYTKAESEALLSPWLGEGLDLSELPTPRMIVVKLDPKQRPDLTVLQADLAEAVSNAVLDDHRLFLERLGDMARAVVAVSTLIFVLILGAMGIAVVSATRAAVATNREIVEVLHIVGAADTFIAREFQRRFLALGLRGALIGGGAAIAFLFLARTLMQNWRATAGGEQMEAMFGDFSIGAEGVIIILSLAGGIALLTGYLSQSIVFRHLRRLG